MLNDLFACLRLMTQPGETVVCAVSGGADSMALLWGTYLLREKLGIRLEAAHFNHHLRGEESQRDEQFVEEFCERFEIPLHLGGGEIKPGKKGLEAAAREARYAFFETLPGKIATAHTADDNAETLLMHLVRGTGLKGLGGISPVNGRLIRPMLVITRARVEAFLQEYHISHVEDSSNHGDAFLRNRLRHHVMPLLVRENPRLAENLSAMALQLRQDEEALAQMAEYDVLPTVTELRERHPAVRARILERFLKENGVKEPEADHIALAESLVFSEKPSAAGHFPGGIAICRNYDRLTVVVGDKFVQETMELPENGSITLPRQRMKVVCTPACELINTEDIFTVCPKGQMVLRCRESGDEMRLSGGTKSVRKLMIDRKVPAHIRLLVPVIADDEGLLGVYGIGVNLDRAAQSLPAIQIRFEPIEIK